MIKYAIRTIIFLSATSSFAQTNIEHVGEHSTSQIISPARYIIRFNYDNAGMVTNIIPTLQTSSESGRSIMQGEGYELSLQARANVSWTSVRLETNNDFSIATPNVTIYSSNGNIVAECTIDKTNMTLDLSYLNKGVYVFVLDNGKEQVSYKLYKRQ